MTRKHRTATLPIHARVYNPHTHRYANVSRALLPHHRSLLTPTLPLHGQGSCQKRMPDGHAKLCVRALSVLRVCARVRVRACEHALTWEFMYLHTYIHTYTHTHTHTHTHMYIIHTCADLGVYVHTYIHTHAYICICIYVYIHTYIYTYIYVYIHI